MASHYLQANTDDLYIKQPPYEQPLDLRDPAVFPVNVRTLLVPNAIDLDLLASLVYLRERMRFYELHSESLCKRRKVVGVGGGF